MKKRVISVGETVIPGLFEEQKWDKQVHFDFLFEYSMKAPTSYEVDTLR